MACCARRCVLSARACHSQRTEALSSAAVGSSSSTRARPLASAAPSTTLRREPVESMSMRLSRCSPSAKPSTIEDQRVASKPGSSARQAAVQACGVSASSAGSRASTWNTARR